MPSRGVTRTRAGRPWPAWASTSIVTSSRSSPSSSRAFSIASSAVRPVASTLSTTLPFLLAASTRRAARRRIDLLVGRFLMTGGRSLRCAVVSGTGGHGGAAHQTAEEILWLQGLPADGETHPGDLEEVADGPVED